MRTQLQEDMGYEQRRGRIELSQNQLAFLKTIKRPQLQEDIYQDMIQQTRDLTSVVD